MALTCFPHLNRHPTTLRNNLGERYLRGKELFARRAAAFFAPFPSEAGPFLPNEAPHLPPLERYLPGRSPLNWCALLERRVG